MKYAVRWTVALCLIAALGGRANADAKGTAILKQAFTTLHAARTYRAKLVRTDLQGRLTSEHEGVVLAMKPNLLKYELKGRIAATYLCDGKRYARFAAGGRFFEPLELKPNPTEFAGEWEGEIDAFFGGPALVSKVEATYAGTTRHDGKDCDLVRARMKSPDRTALYTIGRADHLIYKAVVTVTVNKRTTTQTNTLSNIVLNGPMKATEFRFPAAAGKQPMPTRPAAPKDRIGL